jgi:thymidine kinase
MAELQFFFGTMGSGKSTMALQIHHNLRTRHLRGLLCTQLDRYGAQVSSRLGVSAEAIDVAPDLDLFELARDFRAEHGELHFVIGDEAQFYTPGQIEQLARVVDELDADVYAFGLLTSFQGELFPGTARLIELADRCTPLQVEARCWCGRRATHNARLVDGTQVYDGALMVVDDGGVTIIDDGEANVTYELRCRRHWLSGQGESSPEHQRDLIR